jgi:hypothetical protein
MDYLNFVILAGLLKLHQQKKHIVGLLIMRHHKSYKENNMMKV